MNCYQSFISKKSYLQLWALPHFLKVLGHSARDTLDRNPVYFVSLFWTSFQNFNIKGFSNCWRHGAYFQKKFIRRWIPVEPGSFRFGPGHFHFKIFNNFKYLSWGSWRGLSLQALLGCLGQRAFSSQLNLTSRNNPKLIQTENSRILRPRLIIQCLRVSYCNTSLEKIYNIFK